MNYIELAHRTSASVDQPRERLKNPALLCLLFHKLIEFSKAAKELDTLKRAIFYGKPEVAGNMGIDPIQEVIANRAFSNDDVIEFLHAGIGMATEAGEFLDALVNHIFDGLDLDKVNLAEEIGDTQWYLAKACRIIGTTLEIEQNRNIAKLLARFPDKFTDAAALNRDLENERGVLEVDPMDSPEAEAAGETASAEALQRWERIRSGGAPADQCGDGH